MTMNKKIVVQNKDGKVRFCILRGDGDLQDRLNEWYFGSANPSGYAVEFDPPTMLIRDRIAYDVVTTFTVLSVEDTDEAASNVWIDPETNQTGWN